MFAKQDRIFDEIASDPRRRAEAIKSLTSRRNTFFWLASLTTLLFILASFGDHHGAAGTAFGAITQWMFVFKFDSDLRLLRIVSRLNEKGCFRS